MIPRRSFLTGSVAGFSSIPFLTPNKGIEKVIKKSTIHQPNPNSPAFYVEEINEFNNTRNICYYKDINQAKVSISAFEYHREDGPAVINFENDKCVYEAWYKDGKLHRIGGPARTMEIHHNCIKQEWLVDGVYHREDGPSMILEDNDNQEFHYSYNFHGKLHNTNGPAYIYDSPRHYREEWSINGLSHRTDGPAKTYYEKNSSLKEEDWYVNGLLHRTDGPASIFVNQTGFKNNIYYYKGHRLNYDLAKNIQEGKPLTQNQIDLIERRINVS